MNKKNLIIIFFTLLIIIIAIFYKYNYKNLNNGNTIINKSADQIKEYILNMESYQAVAQITVKSNKNENIYLVKQEYNKKNNYYKQEVLEPSNIAGTIFTYDGKDLKIENTRLNLNKIYKDYTYIESNELSLTSFIEDYKQIDKNLYEENEKQIILETEVKNANKYISNKKLYVNKEGNIEKMEISDTSQNVKIYILYNEIMLNTL